MYGLAIANIMEKVRIGPTIVWIGWEFHISAGFIVLPSLKRDKLLSLIEKLLSSSHCSKRLWKNSLVWPYGVPNYGQPCEPGYITCTGTFMPSQPANSQ